MQAIYVRLIVAEKWFTVVHNFANSNFCQVRRNWQYWFQKQKDKQTSDSIKFGSKNSGHKKE